MDHDHKEAAKKVLEAVEGLTSSAQEQKRFFEGVFEFLGECGGPQYREALTEFEEYRIIADQNEELEGTIEDLKDEIKNLEEETTAKIDDLDAEIDRLRKVVKELEDENFNLERQVRNGR